MTGPIWMIAAEWAARGILLLLIGLSVWSLAIMIDRSRFFRSLLAAQDEQLLKQAQPADHKTAGKSCHVFHRAVISALQQFSDVTKATRAFESCVRQQRPLVEKGFAVLGTLGASAPFIGLLGTVLGIIKAFGDLSMNGDNTSAVMFALAEALVLTAVGLAVAIPAVVAFNYFGKKAKLYYAFTEDLKNEYLNSL